MCGHKMIEIPWHSLLPHYSSQFTTGESPGTTPMEYYPVDRLQLWPIRMKLNLPIRPSQRISAEIRESSINGDAFRLPKWSSAIRSLTCLATEKFTLPGWLIDVHRKVHQHPNTSILSDKREKFSIKSIFQVLERHQNLVDSIYRMIRIQMWTPHDTKV